MSGAPEDIADLARTWFVRMLDDDVAIEEITRWQAWLSDDPRHREAYDRVSDAWIAGGLASAPYADVSTPAANAFGAARPGRRLRLARSAWSPLLAAGLALIFAVGAALVMSAPPAGEARAITTARAEHKAQVLADGSKVSLGGMTGLQVRLGERRRDIRLDHGEAFFKVAHDKSRPFVVETPLGSITAVGTAFNVDVGADQVSLTVTEGVVVVRPGARGPLRSLLTLASGPVRVSAGQRLVVGGPGLRIATRVESAPAQVTWPERRLEYRDEPLRAVVEDVDRYAVHPVLIADSGVGEMRYTGTVNLNAVEAWANGLHAAFPVAVSRRADAALVLAQKTSDDTSASETSRVLAP